MKLFKTLRIGLGVLACLACSELVYAQAYCALRDPVQTIYGLYPSASTYRSIVATVGESAREDIARRLQMPLHHDELGQHTLYVAFKGTVPQGLVHVRAERTQWGLMEIAWALDLDLRVTDFRIQRSRSSSRGFVEAEEFRSGIRGGTATTLAALLVANADTSDARRRRLPDRHLALADAVLRSGLKAIAASESVWGDDIERFRVLAVGSQ